MPPPTTVISLMIDLRNRVRSSRYGATGPVYSSSCGHGFADQLGMAPSCCSSSTAPPRRPCTSSSSVRSGPTSAPGRLPAGMRMPSTRGLATELGVSRGVVTEAYGQLAAEGYLTTSQGAPVRVTAAVRTASPRAPARSLEPAFTYHFHPGMPDLAAFPRERWLRSLRAALRESPLDALGYGDPRGSAPASRSARRLPRAGAQHGSRSRAHGHLHRLHAGPFAALPHARRARRAARSRSRIPAGTRTG